MTYLYYYLLSGVLGACWGSFLNVVAYRGIRDESLMGRSSCRTCHHKIDPLYLIPIISWLFLRGSCAYCRAPISAWYPTIEIITALWTLVLVFVFPLYLLPAMFLFSSALIVTLRTDGESFLILRWCTLGMIPFGLVTSALGFNIVSLPYSILGMASGLCVLGGLSALFYWIRGYQGLGAGDIEFIAAIGSFVGPIGVWITLLIASLSGTVYGLFILWSQKDSSLKTPIPFGVFLALGAAAALLILQTDFLSFN